MGNRSYLEDLFGVYPDDSEYKKMLPHGNPRDCICESIRIPGVIKIDGYRCHGILGSGGYATVYDVTQKNSLFSRFKFSAEHYACKVADLSHPSLNGSDAEEIARSFLQEIVLYYKMKKDRVAGVLPIIAHTAIPEIQRAIREIRKNPSQTIPAKLMMLTPVGLPYQAFLEYLAETGKLKNLTLYEATAIFLDIAEAILQLNKHGILHRDIKPKNIYLARDYEGDLRASLADFNISKAVKIQNGFDQMTRIPPRGEMEYASPYLRSHNISNLPRNVALRLDTYSLGILFYIILNNQKLERSDRGKIPPPKYSPHPKLSDLIIRMMEVNPYKSMSVEEVVKQLYNIAPRLPRRCYYRRTDLPK